MANSGISKAQCPLSHPTPSIPDRLIGAPRDEEARTTGHRLYVSSVGGHGKRVLDLLDLASLFYTNIQSIKNPLVRPNCHQELHRRQRIPPCTRNTLIGEGANRHITITIIMAIHHCMHVNVVICLSLLSLRLVLLINIWYCLCSPSHPAIISQCLGMLLRGYNSSSSSGRGC